jgi:hypothetical protein
MSQVNTIYCADIGTSFPRGKPGIAPISWQKPDIGRIAMRFE